MPARVAKHGRCAEGLSVKTMLCGNTSMGYTLFAELRIAESTIGTAISVSNASP
ncbi:hypothetical protein Poly51_39810 [Rubripirellula tenax]|uniref:Uncharacterized protein n=1 Tax=Rubripirellula tenax TaxID=2528015 RepID=A0A5C6EPA1_9BACT|nr:hypothetical protein Poly51_39810 [Rubripirellula tenax]